MTRSIQGLMTLQLDTLIHTGVYGTGLIVLPSLTIARCIALNAASLVCGFVGNVFLLFNFTRRIRYIVALPMTIILWYFATGIVSLPS